MSLKRELDFKRYLTDNIVGYDGKFSKYILLLPSLYDTLTNLLGSEDVPQSIRSDIYLAMGYLFHADDIFPEEEHGPLGFIEDLLLILVVLRKCAIQKGIGFIEDLSPVKDYPMEQLLTSDFNELTDENTELFDEVLTVTGIDNELYLA